MEGPILGGFGILIMLFVILYLKVPVSFAMALVGILGLTYAISLEAALSLIGSEIWDLFANYSFSVIPMFILLGEFAHYGGYNYALYDVSYKWIGHFRGGLALTTIMSSAAFSAISGSNTATAATMGSVAIPAMKKYNYHPALSAGSVAAGSTLGVMIPPSSVLIIYGLFTGQSIGKLFFGNVIPSAILTILMAATVFMICYQHPDWGPKGPKSTWRERFKALPQGVDILILFVAIMYAFFTGLVTATEAAAAGSALALIICLLRRKLTWERFIFSIIDTLRISCMVLMIIAGAMIFGRFLAVTRLPFEAASWISSLPFPSWMLLGAILVVYMIGGCIMDAMAFLLITLPIFYPIITQMGYDPIWYGQIITITTTMGAITPPVGICVFVVAGMAKDIPVGTVFRGASYFIPAYVIADIILILSPYWTVLVLSDLVR